MRMTKGISWALPTVMSNKVCCEMPTPPLCCDTTSCQKILKSLHELGDGSCNYLSYCLAAAALPRCCWPPLRLVLHLFVLSLAPRAQSPRWAPSRLQDRRLAAPGPADTLVQFLGEVAFLLAWPQAWFCMGSAQLQGTLDQWMAQRERGEHAHPGAHTKCSFLCLCAWLFSPLPVGSG